VPRDLGPDGAQRLLLLRTLLVLFLFCLFLIVLQAHFIVVPTFSPTAELGTMPRPVSASCSRAPACPRATFTYSKPEFIVAHEDGELIGAGARAAFWTDPHCCARWRLRHTARGGIGPRIVKELERLARGHARRQASCCCSHSGAGGFLRQSGLQSVSAPVSPRGRAGKQEFRSIVSDVRHLHCSKTIRTR